MSNAKHDDAYYIGVLDKMSKVVIRRLWAAVLILASALFGAVSYEIRKENRRGSDED